MSDHDSESPPLLPEGKNVSRFTIERLIGRGGYGDIYRARDTEANQSYAIKIEYLEAERQGLEDEIRILKKLRGSERFPSLIDSGECENFKFAVIPLLGPSLSQMRRSLYRSRYTRYSATRLALEMLNCIQELHERGYIHCDIKPGNFLIRPNARYPICLIDFGLSRAYRDRESGKHYEYMADVGFTGTCRYASVHAHREQRLSRRDDLISWFYSVVELAHGKLPWPGQKNREKTLEIKARMKAEELCDGLHENFHIIWQDVKKLSFSGTPHYRRIRGLIKDVIRGLNFVGTPKFDWETADRQVIQNITQIPLDMGEPVELSWSEGSAPVCAACDVS
jgi:serine/threonine protein kinase